MAFFDAGTPPVYVGFGSMPMRASKDIAVAGMIRTDGARVAARLLLDAPGRAP